MAVGATSDFRPATRPQGTLSRAVSDDPRAQADLRSRRDADSRTPLDRRTLIGMRQRSGSRVLAAVLFTDIVDSSAVASRVGDARWKALIARHHAIVRGS